LSSRVPLYEQIAHKPALPWLVVIVPIHDQENMPSLALIKAFDVSVPHLRFDVFSYEEIGFVPPVSNATF
jgi:hypothetical protein